jgi:hypothetical protein
MMGDKVDHNQAGPLAITDAIYQSLLELDSDDTRGVYIAGQGEQPTEKTTEEIARETEEVLARMVWLEAAVASKRHSDQQDDSGSSEDGVGEGHGRSVRSSARLSTRESRSSARRHTMPWPQG